MKSYKGLIYFEREYLGTFVTFEAQKSIYYLKTK